MTNSLFRGKFHCKLDSKGRLVLPSSYRKKTSTKQIPIVITNGQYQGQRCLDAYWLNEWEKLENKISKLSGLKREVMDFRRFYLASGQVVDPDGQNRILMPQSLRKYAKIEENEPIVLVGMGSKFEIWPEKIWQSMFSNLSDQFDSTLDAISGMEE